MNNIFIITFINFPIYIEKLILLLYLFDDTNKKTYYEEVYLKFIFCFLIHLLGFTNFIF